MTDRREFLAASTLALSGVVLGCGRLQPPAAWPESGPAASDPLLRALSYAILAPSSHNAQPWLLKRAAQDALDLFVDRSRLLPLVDPLARQTHISQGCFLEFLDVASRQFGAVMRLSCFPDGYYANDQLPALPVARLVFDTTRTVPRDPLFAAIPRRSTNRMAYDGRPLHQSQLDAIARAAGTGSYVKAILEQSSKTAVCRICEEAMRVEVSSQERNAETATWFRFSDAELNSKRDGFGIAQNGVTGLKKWVAEKLVLSRRRAASPGGLFARGAIDSVRKQTQTAAAFFTLVTTTNNRLDQLLAGRSYARVALTVTALGLQMQPLSQVLEEYSEMQTLQAQFNNELGIPKKDTVQMLFRVGYGRASSGGPRRNVYDLMSNG